MKLKRFVPAVLVVALFTVAGCGRDDGEDLPVIRLDPADAAGQAASLRQTVDVDLADGLELELWAIDTLAPDPIALHVDDLGRVYVTRTNRGKSSEFDIRGYRQWMTESISWTTVEDRRNFLRREFAAERSDTNDWLPDLNEDGTHDWRDLAVEREEVFRIEDTNGDGVADLSRVILRDFADEVADVAGAFLVHEDDMFIGVAPDLWRLKDRDGDGVVDEKASISHGYGVHIGFSGHNISGLIVGPDGRIYWSIGDIGFNVTDADGRQWAYPHQGAILRSNPDGSNFEVFAAGLRNTHEFVFDEFGNLISVDNDGDHPEEHERVVYIVNGSDSGWRTHWQFGKYTDPRNNDYKVWMDEGMYRPRFEDQAAFITPPIAAYHSGPAGMAYNPGTALGEEWRNTFFISEFVGAAARARVHGFKLQPSGASFELAEDRQVMRGILTVGMDFGPDGALYLGDWLDGWGTKNAGRIWKVDVAGGDTSQVRIQTRELLTADLSERADEELANLLGHPDMRVRQKAQFALADRGAGHALVDAARQSQNLLARVHGIWGIWQLAQRDSAAAEPLLALLNSREPEIRAQTAKVLGDVRYRPAADRLIPMLEDSEARVRFFAAEALGRIGHRPAIDAIIQMLEDNNDEDVYLRHAGALALARIGDAEPIVALADHPSRALRIAGVVALRRLQNPEVARFLDDEDEFVVTEAARAINDDGGIEEALPALARLLENQRFSNEALLRRIISANARVGSAEAAQRLTAFAMRRAAPEELRAEAVSAVGVWPQPSVHDRVDGIYLGEVQRDTTIATNALANHADALLRDPSAEVGVATATALGRLHYRPAQPALMTQLRNGRSAALRVAALEALNTMNSEQLDDAINIALADRDERVRMRALELVPTLPIPDDQKAELLGAVAEGGTTVEQQSALAALGDLGGERGNEILGRLLDELESGELDPEIQLEVMEAVERGGTPALQERLEEYRASLPQDDVLAQFAETMYGGDPNAGGRVYFQHAGGQCTRCHAIGGRGGEVGPDLADVGARLSREELLESLVEPNARIAEGFGAEGAMSAMPPMGHVLNRREIRDMVAFLTNLQGNRQGMRQQHEQD